MNNDMNINIINIMNNNMNNSLNNSLNNNNMNNITNNRMNNTSFYLLYSSHLEQFFFEENIQLFSF